MSEETRFPSGPTPHEPEQLEQRDEPRPLEPSRPSGELEQRRQRKELTRDAHRELGRRRERSLQPADPEWEEDFPEPSEEAILRIERGRVEVSARGPLTLGIVGPAATIVAGHLADLPVWAILAICAGQIVAAVVMRRRR